MSSSEGGGLSSPLALIYMTTMQQTQPVVLQGKRVTVGFYKVALVSRREVHKMNLNGCRGV